MFNIIKKTWIQTVAVTFFTMFGSFLTSAVMARVMGPEGRGFVFAYFLVANLASTLSQIGLANSLVYNFGKKSVHNRYFFALISCFVVLFLTMPISIVGVKYILSETYNKNKYLAILLSFSLSYISFMMVLSQIQKSLNIYNMMRMWQPILVLGYFAAAYILNSKPTYGEVIFLQSLTMILISSGAFYVLYIKKYFDNVQKNPLKPQLFELINYAIKYYGTTFIGLIVVNVDKIFLVGKVSAINYGFYALAYATSRIFGAIQDAAAVTIFSKYAGQPSEKLNNAVNMAFRVSFLPMLCIVTLVSLFGDHIINFIFGSSFDPMVIPFILLSYEAVFGAASWTLAQRFNAGGKPGIILMRQIIVVVPLIVGMAFLPKDNVVIWLSAAMLLASVVRLGVTMAMFPLVLKEKYPKIFPALNDFKGI